MALVLTTNLAASTAQRYLGSSQTALAVSMRRLASGLRISSASDDASGLAIASDLEAQVRGAQKAIHNVNEAISLCQVLDGFAGQMTNNLQRVRELCLQSASGTLSASNRLNLNREVQMVLQEVDRSAAGLLFNGKAVGDGTYGVGTFQIGANSGETIDLTLSTSFRRADLGILQTVTSGDLRNIGAFTYDNTYTTAPLGVLDFSQVNAPFVGGSATTAGTPATDYSGAGASVISVDGINVTLSANYGSLSGVQGAIQTQLNSSNPGQYTVSVQGSALKISKTSSASSPTAAVSMGSVSGSNAAGFDGATTANGSLATTATQAGFTVDGHAVSLTANHSGDVGGLIADIQTQLDATSVPGTYSVSGDINGLSIARVGDIVAPSISGFSGIGASVFAPGAADTLTLGAGDFSVQVGSGPVKSITGTFATAQALAAAVNACGLDVRATINANTGAMDISSPGEITLGGAQASGAFGFGSLTSTAGGSLANVSALDAQNALGALQRIDAALDTFNTARATYGATQNRLESMVRNLGSTADNLQAARGRIMDADYAHESTNLARRQVLQQAGFSVLAQANLSPQLVLRLLR